MHSQGERETGRVRKEESEKERRRRRTETNKKYLINKIG
jgi:hypothetical protein